MYIHKYESREKLTTERRTRDGTDGQRTDDNDDDDGSDDGIDGRTDRGRRRRWDGHGGTDGKTIYIVLEFQV